MKSRDVEIFILKKIQDLYPNFTCRVFSDYKYTTKIEPLPRILTKTISNEIVERYQKRSSSTDNKKAVFYQYEVHKQIISLTISLSKTEDESTVEEIRKLFTHRIGTDWGIDRSGENIVIEEVTPIIDISLYNNASYLERYTFDVIVRSLEVNTTEINYIETVEFKINKWRGKCQ